MLKTLITGVTNDGEPVHTYVRDGNVGILAYTAPQTIRSSTGRPFLNEVYGAALNQDVTFAGVPELIHNGGDAVGWVGVANSGIWNFADTTDSFAGSAHVSITAANDLDNASFIDATEIDMASYTAITGQIQLVTYNPISNAALLQFENNGALVGDFIDLADYIDTGLLGAYQSFVIPKADMGVVGSIVDQLNITMVRSGATKPTIYFDNIQIEELGDPITYIIRPAPGTIFNINTIAYHWADAGTAGAAYAYNKMGALPSLPNGTVLTVSSRGGPGFTSTFRQLSDILLSGTVIVNFVDDGINTFVTAALPTVNEGGVILDSRFDDFISLTVNDDLTGLLLFQAFASGLEEIII